MSSKTRSHQNSPVSMKYDQFKTDDFKCTHLNVRSLYRNYDEIGHFLHDNNIHVLALNETLLDDSISDSELRVQDYDLLRKDRNRNGGGVAIYIQNSITYEVVNSEVFDSLELLLIKIRPKSSSPFLFMSWYRPPDSKIELMDRYERVLAFIDTFRLDVVVMGDVNCDLKKPYKSNMIKRYEEVNTLYSMQQINTTMFTRITHISKSLIDHMLTNATDMIRTHGVISIALSDHDLCYLILNFKSVRNPKTITFRNLKKVNLEAFRNHLSNHPWHEIETCKSLDEEIDLWESFLLKSIDEFAPLKKKRVRNQPAPWLNSDIKQIMKIRDGLKRKASKSNNEELMNRYRKAKNLVTKKIRAAKKAHFSKQLSDTAKSTSNIWPVLKSLLPSKKATQNYNPGTEDSLLANQFNNFFANVGADLAATIPNVNCNKNCSKYDNCNDLLFELTPVSEEDVLKAIQGMSNKKSTGVDNISILMIKMAVPTIVPSLTHICNRSLSERTFPTKWKRSKIIPIHKSGNKKSANNYRPISILPSVSKILERLVQVQLTDYLKFNNILSEAQSGFRKNHSTISALLKVTDDWLSAIDHGLLTGAVFIDLRKAFDTVDPFILLNKLSNIGVSASCLSWFRSYLTGRRICTVINSSTSKESSIDYGVPQGSILGPLLFVIYIDDLVKHLEQCSVHLYADDTVIYFSNKDVHMIESVLNSELQNIFDWLGSSKLSLNCNKTVCMLFGSPGMLQKYNQVHITVNNARIQQVQSTKYLGMILDPNLKWNLHIDHMSNRISKLVRMLSRLRHTLNISNMKIVYNAIILPIFDYGDVLYGSGAAKYTDSLQKLQNRAFRILLGLSPYEHVSIKELHSRLGYKSLEFRRFCHLNTMVYKAINELAPPYLKSSFHFCQYNYLLRSNGKLALPRPRTDYLKRSFSYRGAMQFNNLPPELKLSTSVASFSNRLRSISPDFL